MEYFYFLACPLHIHGMKFMEKDVQQSENMWHYMKCNGPFLESDYHYVLCLELHNHTRHLENVIAFNDTTTKLLVATTKDLFLLSSELESIRDISTKIKYHHLFFTISIKIDTFNIIECLCPTLMHFDLCSKFISFLLKKPK